MRVPSGPSVSISSASAAAGNSPRMLGRPRTRVRRRPGMVAPRPIPDGPCVFGLPAGGSGHMTPPGSSSEPIRTLTTSTSHEATVPSGIVRPSAVASPEVVVPMRP